MKRFKEILVNVLKRIKKSNLVRLIKSRSIIKDLNEKIRDLEKEKQELHDYITLIENEKLELEKRCFKSSELELVIESSDKSIKEKIEENEKLEEKRIELETQLFNARSEAVMYKIQIEEYEAQINDLKSDRYLIRKIPSGKTPNTNKTKISKPMSARVVKYMREEHE